MKVKCCVCNKIRKDDVWTDEIAPTHEHKEYSDTFCKKHEIEMIEKIKQMKKNRSIQ